jgi:hypothetical protein
VCVIVGNKQCLNIVDARCKYEDEEYLKKSVHPVGYLTEINISISQKKIAINNAEPIIFVILQVGISNSNNK